MRSVAGAISRRARVDVLVARSGPPPGPDGAFSQISIGPPAPGSSWPALGEGSDTRDAGCYAAVLVDADDRDAGAFARSRYHGAAVLAVGASGAHEALVATGLLDVGLALPGPTEPRSRTCTVFRVGLYVRVHPYAAEQPHHELRGSSGYLLVLGRPSQADAPRTHAAPEVRWLVARFSRQRVVVVERGVAREFRSRSLVNEFGVHSRMDLWRLLAHAHTTIDLAPGPLYARECVESLRYGVPVVVAAGHAAHALVSAGAGTAFTTPGELVTAVEGLNSPAARGRAVARGRAAIERWYADPVSFVTRVGGAIDAVVE